MRVLIVDVSQLAHRVWHIFQNPHRSDLRNSRQEPTGIQFGSLRVIHAMVKEVKPQKLVFVWDQKPVAKKALNETYKAGRGSWSDEFRTAMGALKTFWSYFGVTHVDSVDQEADDTIASVVVQQYPTDLCFILSSDNDFLQLVRDGHVVVIKPPLGSQQLTYVDEERVHSEWGVAPSLMPHLRSIIGDSSDNLPGVPRFPKKKAAELITEAGSLEALYLGWERVKTRLSDTEAQKLLEAKSKVLQNLQLMQLQTNLPLRVEQAQFNLGGIQAELVRLEFKSYLGKLKELEDDFIKPPRVVTSGSDQYGT